MLMQASWPHVINSRPIFESILQYIASTLSNAVHIEYTLAEILPKGSAVQYTAGGLSFEPSCLTG